MHQHKSALGIHMSPPSGALLPLPASSNPSGLSQSTGFGLPGLYMESTLATNFTYGNVMFQCYSPKSSHRLIPSLCPKCLCPLCCPASRIINTIFLDSIYPPVTSVCFSQKRKLGLGKIQGLTQEDHGPWQGCKHPGMDSLCSHCPSRVDEGRKGHTCLVLSCLCTVLPGTSLGHRGKGLS